MNSRINLGQPNWLWVLFAFVLGAILGWLLLGYVLFPVQYINADPWDLNPAARSEWIVLTADAYSSNQDLNLARNRLRGFTPTEIEQTLRQEFTARNTKGDAIGAARVQAFGQTLGLSVAGASAQPPPQATPAPTTGAGLFDNVGLLLLVLGVVILLLALGLFLYMRLRGVATPTSPRATLRPATAGYGEATAETTRVSPAPLREEPPLAPPRPSPTAAVRGAPPPPTRTLGTFAATYKYGEDDYDTSFTLETARGEFLGECGMGTSEKIGEGKPDKVTAFDVWLFDKTDVRTVTQILMSEWAYNDQATRARLATKGELVLAEKGKSIRLETATLTVDAEIVDLVYASTPGLPPNSHFQKLIVEMVPAQK